MCRLKRDIYSSEVKKCEQIDRIYARQSKKQKKRNKQNEKQLLELQYSRSLRLHLQICIEPSSHLTIVVRRWWCLMS